MRERQQGQRVKSFSLPDIWRRIPWPTGKWPWRVCLGGMVVCLLLCVFFVWKFASCVIEDRQQVTFNADLRRRVVSSTPEDASPVWRPPITVDFAALQAENPDIVGWIYCPDTEVNYPVLRGEDNRTYLRHLSDGSYNVAGSIFADFRNSPELAEENVILYGHNMSNGTMFALLPKYAQQEFYDAHPLWYLLTPTANYRVELFAGFVTSTKSLVYDTTRLDTNGRPITDKAWEDSDFRGVNPPKEGERTLTLSTCSYDFSGARYVVMGILREMDGT